MKKITLLLLLLISASAFSQSQKWDQDLPANATTDKEYNYLTVGMKTQIASGFDIIDGYALNECSNDKLGNYNFNIQYLVNKKTNKFKALSVIITSYVSGKTFYICVPINNKNLMGKYWQLLNSFDASMAKTYAYKMSDLFMGAMIMTNK